MSLYDWISNTATRVRTDGTAGVYDSVYNLYSGGWRIACARVPFGTNVFEREWDMLVILDGCRTDLFEEIGGEYDTLGPVEEMLSVGSSSREWLAKTFSPEHRDEIERTAYVSANPYTDEILFDRSTESQSPFNPANWETVDPEVFVTVEDVSVHWDDELGTVPPRTVTDAAIRVGRELSPERLIVHYMQPHQPFIRRTGEGSEWRGSNCWTALRRGETDRETLWNAYRDNLRVVLDDVEVLLENVDATETVLSADHGNAIGEWGVYGHPSGFPHPTVKRVPWVRTTAADVGTYTPGKSIETRQSTSTVEGRLKDLGYL